MERWSPKPGAEAAPNFNICFGNLTARCNASKQKSISAFRLTLAGRKPCSSGTESNGAAASAAEREKKVNLRCGGEAFAVSGKGR